MLLCLCSLPVCLPVRLRLLSLSLSLSLCFFLSISLFLSLSIFNSELAVQIHEVLQGFLKHLPQFSSQLLIGGTDEAEDIQHARACVCFDLSMHFSLSRSLALLLTLSVSVSALLCFHLLLSRWFLLLFSFSCHIYCRASSISTSLTPIPYISRVSKSTGGTFLWAHQGG